MWEVSHCTKTSELESRRLLKSPEDTPVSLWRPQFKNVAQEYSGILTEQLLAPRPNLPVHKRWWWKWDQKSWRPVWCTYLKMPSQTESDGCWGHNVHFGLTLLCFVLWSLGHLGEGETESPSSEMCLSQRGNEKINSSFFFLTLWGLTTWKVSMYVSVGVTLSLGKCMRESVWCLRLRNLCISRCHCVASTAYDNLQMAAWWDHRWHPVGGIRNGGKTTDSVLETASWKKDCDTGSEKRNGARDDTMLKRTVVKQCVTNSSDWTTTLHKIYDILIIYIFIKINLTADFYFYSSGIRRGLLVFLNI